VLGRRTDHNDGRRLENESSRSNGAQSGAPDWVDAVSGYCHGNRPRLALSGRHLDLSQRRPQRPVAELRAASKELLYEIERFFDCSRLLSERSQLHSLGEAFEEAVGVAFLVHGRSLTHVFFPDRPRLNDVVASDFFVNPSDWDSSAYATEDEVRSIRRWVSRDVAHVSYQRLIRGADRRDVGLIRQILIRATLGFAEAVPSAIVSNGFSEAATTAATRGS
jgi:hypothetical protein